MIEGRGFGGWGAIEIAANGRTGAATPTFVGLHRRRRPTLSRRLLSRDLGRPKSSN